jgi:hypothetical protein
MWRSGSDTSELITILTDETAGDAWSWQGWTVLTDGRMPIALPMSCLWTWWARILWVEMMDVARKGNTSW